MNINIEKLNSKTVPIPGLIEQKIKETNSFILRKILTEWIYHVIDYVKSIKVCVILMMVASYT